MRTIKELREKRNELVDEMAALLEEIDERDLPELNEEESNRYNECNREIDALSEQIRRLEALDERRNNIDTSDNERNDSADSGDDNHDEGNVEDSERQQQEERAFLALFTGDKPIEELRAAQNLKFTDNGAIVPTHIAKKITEKLENICPIYEKVTKFHFKGKVSFPILDDENDDVICAYAEEFTELEGHAPGFKTIDLDGYLFGALTKISRSLINNTDIPLLNYIITRMAYAKKKTLEKELLIGTSGKMTGALSTENVLEAASSVALTADELIDLQGTIPDEYQKGCCWIMNPTTRDAIRKLKDENGRYLFNCDITTGYKPVILSKPVFTSDQMPKMEAGNKAVFYGDPKGLYVNIREDDSIVILREKYATQHAIGVNLWFECDSKIVEKQKLSVLKMKNA